MATFDRGFKSFLGLNLRLLTALEEWPLHLNLCERSAEHDCARIALRLPTIVMTDEE